MAIVWYLIVHIGAAQEQNKPWDAPPFVLSLSSLTLLSGAGFRQDVGCGAGCERNSFAGERANEHPGSVTGQRTIERAVRDEAKELVRFVMEGGGGGGGGGSCRMHVCMWPRSWGAELL